MLPRVLSHLFTLPLQAWGNTDIPSMTILFSIWQAGGDFILAWKCHSKTSQRIDVAPGLLKEPWMNFPGLNLWKEILSWYLSWNKTEGFFYYFILLDMRLLEWESFEKNEMGWRYCKGFKSEWLCWRTISIRES